MAAPTANDDALLRQALAAHQSGQIDRAIPLYRKLLARFADNAQILYLLGTAEAQCGRFSDGVAMLERSLQIAPDNPVAHFNLGKALHHLGRCDDAVWSYARAVGLKPDYAEALFNMAKALRDLARFEEALHCYDQLIRLKPKHALALLHRGSVLHALKQLPDALNSIDAALGARPDWIEALIDRAAVQQDMQRHEDALRSLEQVLRHDPNCAEAHLDRGSVLHDLGHAQEALVSIERAIALKPAVAEAHYNRGDVLQDLKRFDEAIRSYDRAIELKPDFADAYWNKALVALLTGDFEAGWPLYEWRAQGSRRIAGADPSVKPLWLGEVPIAGKTLLVQSEQGIGDIIQFCRYLPLVEALGANIIFELPRAVLTLVQTLPCRFVAVERSTEVPPHDLRCPLLSLPLALRTTLQTVPAQTPYLNPDERKREAWRTRLGAKRGMRIGLAWSGNPRHINDRRRSIRFTSLLPLLELTCEFHSLQIECRAEDRQAIAKATQLHDHRNDLADFSDTAALVAEMDLVISVDTAVAHVAAALGRPVWVLLPFVPDFRWLLDRSDSPWYPTATLYRQPALGDWAGVIAKVRDDLKSMLSR
jgi:tetratricopeptide (TPR) repeat protein